MLQPNNAKVVWICFVLLVGLVSFSDCIGIPSPTCVDTENKQPQNGQCVCKPTFSRTSVGSCEPNADCTQAGTSSNLVRSGIFTIPSGETTTSNEYSLTYASAMKALASGHKYRSAVTLVSFESNSPNSLVRLKAIVSNLIPQNLKLTFTLTVGQASQWKLLQYNFVTVHPEFSQSKVIPTFVPFTFSSSSAYFDRVATTDKSVPINSGRAEEFSNLGIGCGFVNASQGNTLKTNYALGLECATNGIEFFQFYFMISGIDSATPTNKDIFSVKLDLADKNNNVASKTTFTPAEAKNFVKQVPTVSQIPPPQFSEASGPYILYKAANFPIRMTELVVTGIIVFRPNGFQSPKNLPETFVSSLSFAVSVFGQRILSRQNPNIFTGQTYRPGVYPRENRIVGYSSFMFNSSNTIAKLIGTVYSQNQLQFSKSQTFGAESVRFTEVWTGHEDSTLCSGSFGQLTLTDLPIARKESVVTPPSQSVQTVNYRSDSLGTQTIDYIVKKADTAFPAKTLITLRMSYTVQVDSTYAGLRVTLKAQAVSGNLAATTGYTMTVTFNGNSAQTFLLKLNSQPSLDAVFNQGPTMTIDFVMAIQKEDTDVLVRVAWSISPFKVIYNPASGCCAKKCPDGSGINIASSLNILPSCSICSDQQLVYSPFTKKCVCKPGFTIDPSLVPSVVNCKPCKGTLCEACSLANINVCSKCIINAEPIPTGSCRCVNGFFYSTDKCVRCESKCATCTSSTTCLTCAGDNRGALPDCNCVPGAFLDPNGQCKLCNLKCLTCQDDKTCATCDSAAFRKLNPLGLTTCICIDGYYELTLSSSLALCSKCDVTCLTCGQRPTNCLTCDATNFRVLLTQNGISSCQCAIGYVPSVNGGCVQTDCTSDKNCAQCNTTNKVCTACSSSAYRVLNAINFLCQCDVGYYEDSVTKVCMPCSLGCQTCTSKTNCLICIVPATPNGDGTCKCPVKSFIFADPVAEVTYCQNCVQNCLTCSNKISCQTCVATFTLTNSVCGCSKGTYLVKTPTQSCQPCSTNCLACTSAVFCLECGNGLFISNGACLSSCPSQTYPASGVCTPCPSFCLTCDSAISCKTCVDPYIYWNSQCLVKCPDTTLFIAASKTCVACTAPCKTCTGNLNFCTSCLDPAFGISSSDGGKLQTCVNPCPAGMFKNDLYCTACATECLTCQGLATTCTSCTASLYLYQGKCVTSCPAILFDKLCLTVCPNGFFSSSATSCQKCDSNCKNCKNSAIECTQCQTGFQLQGRTCKITCTAPTIAYEGICTACDVSCATCIDSPFTCTKCASGYNRLGLRCVNNCPASTILNITINTCQPCRSPCQECLNLLTYCTICQNPDQRAINGLCLNCNPSCLTCSSFDACTTCASNLVLVGTLCQPRCPTGSINSNGICKCTTGVLSNGICTSQCNPGSFADLNTQCQLCSSNCATCSGTATNCLSCTPPLFILNQACVPLSNIPCAQGSYVDPQNGICRRVCQAGYLLSSSGVCLLGFCPDGQMNNGFGGCVAKSSSDPIQCQSGYLYNNQCVESCPLKTYSSVNKECLPCGSNCNFCSSPTECVACLPGFILTNGACQAPITCGPNQVAFKGSCLAACPAGTFKQGNYCIRQCDAQYYFYVAACYTDCPTGLRDSNSCLTECSIGTTNQAGVCL